MFHWHWQRWCGRMWQQQCCFRWLGAYHSCEIETAILVQNVTHVINKHSAYWALLNMLRRQLDFNPPTRRRSANSSMAVKRQYCACSAAFLIAEREAKVKKEIQSVRYARQSMHCTVSHSLAVYLSRSLRSPRDYYALEIRLELNNQLLSDLVEKCRSIVTSMRQFKVGSRCHRCRVNVKAPIDRRSVHIMNTFSFTSITRVLSCNLFNRFDFNSLHVTTFRFFLVPLRSLERSYTRWWCVSSITHM